MSTSVAELRQILRRWQYPRTRDFGVDGVIHDWAPIPVDDLTDEQIKAIAMRIASESKESK